MRLTAAWWNASFEAYPKSLATQLLAFSSNLLVYYWFSQIISRFHHNNIAINFARMYVYVFAVLTFRFPWNKISYPVAIQLIVYTAWTYSEFFLIYLANPIILRSVLVKYTHTFCHLHLFAKIGPFVCCARLSPLESRRYLMCFSYEKVENYTLFSANILSSMQHPSLMSP